MHEKMNWKKTTKGVDDPVNTECEQCGLNPLSIAHYSTQNKMQLYLTLFISYFEVRPKQACKCQQCQIGPINISLSCTNTDRRSFLRGYRMAACRFQTYKNVKKKNIVTFFYKLVLIRALVCTQA